MEPIRSDPEILGGTPCFPGTRVPVESLFDHLKAGYTVDFFIAEFPTVKKEQALAVLDWAQHLAAAQRRRAAG